jgi:hypothetical protein
MVARFQRPFKIVALNANDFARQRYELSKQLRKLLRKLQRVLSSIEMWYQHMKFNEDRTESSTSLIDVDHLRLTSQ